jgi:hypothetical protein
MFKLPRILFFISGTLPTEDDFAKASEIKGNVVFRNASAVPNEEHSLETCDGVAGAVPEIYAKRFATAEEAVNGTTAAFSELTTKVGDEAPPKAKAEPSKLDQKAKAAWSPNR